MNQTKLFLILSLFLLVSCSENLKRKIGITISPPDEYTVPKNRPLSMPPRFTLDEINSVNNSNNTNQKDSNLSKEEDKFLSDILMK